MEKLNMKYLKILFAFIGMGLFGYVGQAQTLGGVYTIASDNGNNSTDDIVYHERALDVYDNIVRHFYVDEHNLFMENYPELPGDKEVAFLWSYFGLVGGLHLRS